eukprot:CAMPEP_0206147194 /NCGR_PEP_ID=MMETSP1473-20131121/32712_1 /ASSEMBLY_ACC=CAM_ASM_001109 /TAXON_ID=1461547 /ORGANISM="Stichococcus sp, Strain RCC1054" /LENGTH=334 /DNA_ID=CAMNT_0053544035 /DNA_START=358 /DNA_END=1362 /DNA_ORIENTATION=+
MYETHRIRCQDGQTLALYDLGGQGPVLLILHAAGFLGQAYAPLADALCDAYHCYALDIRGHGKSAAAAFANDAFVAPQGMKLGREAVLPQRPTETSSRHVQTLRADLLSVVAWLKKQHSEPIFAFGHSLGGLLSLTVEIARPGTFAAMYLYEPVCWKHSSESEQGKQAQRNGSILSDLALRRKTHFPSKVAVMENWRQKIPFNHFDIAALALLVEHGFETASEGGDEVTLVCDAKRVEAYSYLVIADMSEQTFQRLPEIQCPVAVARGTGGWPMDFVMLLAPAVVFRLPNGRLITLEGLHHFGPLEAPHRLADSAREFFTGVLAGPASKHRSKL